MQWHPPSVYSKVSLVCAAQVEAGHAAAKQMQQEADSACRCPHSLNPGKQVEREWAKQCRDQKKNMRLRDAHSRGPSPLNVPLFLGLLGRKEALRQALWRRPSRRGE